MNATSVDALAIRRVLNERIPKWSVPQRFGPDGWVFLRGSPRRSLIVTVAPADDGCDWVHASMAGLDGELPTYEELTALHAAVFGDGWAYQLFAPRAQHVNIHEHALHLFGRLDGAAALPDFTYGSGSI